jgi:hypothetical protein
MKKKETKNNNADYNAEDIISLCCRPGNWINKPMIKCCGIVADAGCQN